MTKRRKPGEGTIRTLPSGRHQVGVTTASGERFWSEPFDSLAEADSVRRGLLAELADAGRAAVGGATFNGYAAPTFDRLERERRYAPKTLVNYRSRVGVHVAPEAWASVPFGAVRVPTVTRFLDALDGEVSRSTARVTLAAIRIVYWHAVRAGVAPSDPTAGYRFPRREASELADERSFFQPAQLAALRNVANREERCLMRIAHCSGMRLDEMVHLHTRDVRLDARDPFVDVLYGSRHAGKLRPPKGGKTRRLYLFDDLHAALDEWKRVHLPRYERNPLGLMFPAQSGEYRNSRRFLYGSEGPRERWPILLAEAQLAEVRPKLVWHSFRHTCATDLLSGAFGHKWAPEEVQSFLGHKTLAVTMRYAKIAEDRLVELAKITRRSRSQTTLKNRPSRESADNIVFADVREENRDLTALRDRALIAVDAGDGAEAMRLGTEIAEAVLDTPIVRAALAVLDGGEDHRVARILELTAALTPAADSTPLSGAGGGR